MVATDELLGTKFQLRISIEFFKPTNPNKETVAHFTSRQEVALPASDLRAAIDSAFRTLSERVDNFQAVGSGWAIRNVIDTTLHIAKYAPIGGSAYIPLPKELAAKRAIISIQNKDDEMCFVWSVLAALFPPRDHPYRQSWYQPLLNRLDLSGLQFPVPLDQIPMFARRNNLSIAVYGYRKRIYPLQLPAERLERHINLLYQREGGKSHYSWIKNLNALLFDRNAHKNKKYYCQLCLRTFYLEGQQIAHERICNEDIQRVVMPEKDEKLRFEMFRKMVRSPYVIYADFECLLEKVDTCQPGPCLRSFTQPTQIHTPSGFAMIGVRNCCSNSPVQSDEPEVYRGENCLEVFFRRLLDKHESYLNNFHQRRRALQLTPTAATTHQLSDSCHICLKALNGDKVADHCHVCGNFIGSAHSACNIACQLNADLPVLFHNLRRYDGHLLMQHIGNVAHQLGFVLDCVPRGLDDYMTFSLIKRERNKITARIRFMDSCQFLPTSLNTLVENLAKGGLSKFSVLSQNFAEPNSRLLLRKGIFSYEYMDSMKRFDEHQLPPIEAFHSSLTDETVSEQDYAHAEAVWMAFNIRNLGEYQDLYVKTDVLLLADVFQNFRAFCFVNYRLDPCQFFTLGSLSWSACLLMTDVALDLLHDRDMYQFFEMGMRGGVAVISHRYARANNPLLSDFVPTWPESYILYLDAINLYGWAMTQYLPTSEFMWMTEEELDSFDVHQVEDDGETGYMLEVDLDYPQQLHDLHNCYPLAPERLKVPFSMMSPYCQRLHETLGVDGAGAEKLVPNLYPKQNYIVHYRNLKLYNRLGLLTTKLHRGIKFKQQPWLRKYIDFNTQKRRNATNDFEKDLYKLLNNIIFGKSCENVRNYRTVRLVADPEEFMKLVRKREYLRSEVFYEHLIAVELLRKEVTLDKPIYTGITVLDLSKLLMYDFHYNKMDGLRRQKFDVRLLFTDTDSLCYHLTGPDLYGSLVPFQDLFDFSDYPTDHHLFSLVNKKVMGKMKDETASRPIREFVGIRAKMYSLDCVDHTKKRAKGVSKPVIRKKLTHAMYVDTLRNEHVRRDRMVRLSSQKHHINTVAYNKVSLSPFDNKRYLKEDGISSLAYGHRSIPKQI